MTRPYSIAHGRTTEHAEQLRLGLSRMHPEFTAYLCTVCDGRGEYRQNYNAGCGGGMFRSMGPCEYCDATGLCQGAGVRNPAPDSVREQVLQASTQKNP
jgi:DnaJ-class molecular chaperone